LNKSSSRATLIASGALVLWALEPLVVAELEGFPLFESLTLVFSSCFILTSIRVTISGKWQAILRQPLFVWLFGLLAICGSDFAYMLGAYTAPIAHVDLIDYLWPFLVIVFIGFSPNENFSYQSFWGALCGFAGVVYMLAGGEGFNHAHVLGYGLALVGMLIWGFYSAYSRKKPDVPSDIVGIICGLGAIITLILHLNLERTVMPSSSQAGLAILLGLAGPGLAYQLWDYGMKFGNATWLSACCYFARMSAMALLVFFGKEPLSPHLLIACALATLGVVISSVNLTAIMHKLRLLKESRSILISDFDVSTIENSPII